MDNGKKVFVLLSSSVAMIAAAASCTACWWFMYQPKTPKCLQK